MRLAPLLLTLAACDDFELAPPDIDTPPTAASLPPSVVPVSAAAPPSSVDPATLATSMKPEEWKRLTTPPVGDPAKSAVVTAWKWSDQNGENLALFGNVGADDKNGSQLWVRVVSGADKKELRLVKDGVEVCEFDTTCAFADGATGVTDLDKDGVSELTFAYRLACRSDVSPSDLKLLVLEGTDKYILRGSSFIDFGDGGAVGGDFKPDPEKAKWPAGFDAHAEKTWAAVRKEF